VTGHAHAVLDFPFNTVSAHQNPNQWCGSDDPAPEHQVPPRQWIVQCPADRAAKRSMRTQKTPQLLERCLSLSFQFKLTEATNNFMSGEFVLAKIRPCWCFEDYRMTLGEAVALPSASRLSI
jgi:hypothetical protein